MFSKRLLTVLSLTAVALIVGGCGGSSDSTSRSASSSPSSRGGSGTTVSATENPELGVILVDAEGLTVYSFAKDQGTTSSCYGACAESWPPVIVKGAPSAGEGASSSQLGTTKRKDGTMQATYAGHPIYTFAEDAEPGETNGNGLTAFGGSWSALNESGGPPSGGGESSGTGGY